MKMREARLRAALCCLVGSFLMVVAANGATIATFADPASDGTTPLFDLDNTATPNPILSGGWDGTDPNLPMLTLQVPWTGMTYQDASFTMTDLEVTGEGELGPGQINFFAAGDPNTPVLSITFETARIFGNFGFGGAGFNGDDMVVFSGPGIPPADELMEEQFSFSFANTVATQTGYTYTASFTSSAIPEPSALVLLGAGPLILLRRRG